MQSVTLLLPGEPHAQGRPRTAVIGGHARIYDPATSRRWKADAQAAMRIQLAEQGVRVPVVAEGPVRLEVRCVFSCPKSDYRKREPRSRRWHTKRPDLDNVVKAVKDAAKAVLWLDDSQVVELHASKIIGAQGEAPSIELSVSSLASPEHVYLMAPRPQR